MKQFLRSWAIILCLGVSLINLFAFRTSEEHSQDVLVGDGRGYYAYLPQIFLYGTLDYEELDQLAKSDQIEGKINGAFIKHTPDGRVNKYSIGTAILQLPFFGIAAAYTVAGNMPVTGYNSAFQFLIALGAVFYAFLGLFFLWKTLALFKLKAGTRSLLLLLVYGGTNLYYYTLFAPVMSHVYSFALVCIWMYLVVQHFRRRKKTLLIGWIAVYMLICLVRPLNALVILFVPFLTHRNYLMDVVKDYKIWFLGFFIGAFPWAFQSVVWNIQTDQFLFWSYQGEGFQFHNFRFDDFWLSFRKGALVYCPALILPLIRIIRKIRKKSSWFYLAPLLIISFIASAWWIWYYGDSFGQRVLIDYYGLLFIPAALWMGNRSLKWWYGVVGLLVCINVLFTYQYSKGIIHPNSMNKQRFFTVLGKTSEKYAFIFSEQKQAYFGTPDEEKALTVHFDLSKSSDYWSYRNIALADTNHVEWMRKGVEFSNTFDIRGTELPKSNSAYLIKFNVDVLQPNFGATNRSKVVFHAMRKESPYEDPVTLSYDVLPLYSNRIKEHKGWEHLSYEYFLYTHLQENDIFRLYIWNPRGDSYVLDNFNISLIPLIQDGD